MIDCVVEGEVVDLFDITVQPSGAAEEEVEAAVTTALRKKT